MALSTNDILKIVVSMNLPNGVVGQNVFWASFDNDGTSQDEDDAVTDIDTWVTAIYAHLLAQHHPSWSCDEVKVYVYDAGDDDFDEIGSSPVTGVGTSSGDYLPHGVAALTRANTVNADVQARKFWALATESQQSSGILTAAYITALALANSEWVNTFVGAQTGSTFTPGVYSLAKSAFYEFTFDTFINTFWGYQRRRKPGVGI